MVEDDDDESEVDEDSEVEDDPEVEEDSVADVVEDSVADVVEVSLTVSAPSQSRTLQAIAPRKMSVSMIWRFMTIT